jgi:hypothetical protein
MRRLFIPIVLLLLISSPAFAQTAEILQTFHGPAAITSGLARAADGRLYGISTSGLLRVDPGGAVSIVHAFSPGVRFYLPAPMVASDGTVYGLTDAGGAHRAGSVFGFVPSTGAFRTVYSFPSSSANGASGALVQASDGLLYGTVRGQIWRIDPTTGAASALAKTLATDWIAVGTVLYGTTSQVYSTAQQLVRFDTVTATTTVLHTLAGGAAGQRFVAPVRATDGLIVALAGVVNSNVPAPTAQVVVVDPATDAVSIVDVAAVMPFVSAGPPAAPAEAADGHFYGSAASGGQLQMYRLRRLGGGGFSSELLPVTVTEGAIGSLALSADGFLYGVNLSDDVYRFDPLEQGGAGDEFQFSIVHAIGGTGLSDPSTPLAGADGFLYGLVTNEQASIRSLVAYRLSPITAALELKGSFPDEVGTGLAEGDPGILYRLSSVLVAGMRRTRVFRLDGASGAVTTVLDQTEPASQGDFKPGLVRAPDGRLVGLRDVASSTRVAAVRFDPIAGTLTEIASTDNFWTWSDPIVAGDGRIYVTATSLGFNPGGTRNVQLRRIRDDSGEFEPVFDFRIAYDSKPTPMAAPGATLYLQDSNAGIRRLVQVDPTVTPASSTTVCIGSAADVVGPGGHLYKVEQGVLSACDLATGQVTSSPLPARMFEGVAPVGPGVFVNGLLYGALRHSTFLPTAPDALFRIALTGGLTPIDTDGDGLSNEWESRYGLDPSATSGDNGAAGDPDGDGITNAQEMAAGSHPRGLVTRLFAEGATGTFFHTEFALANPTAVSATALMRFQTDSGATIPLNVTVSPFSRLTIDPSTTAGLAGANFSTVVESDVFVAADRKMTWDATRYGSHYETGVAAPSIAWYFAEGSTSGDFFLYYLLQNPGDTAETATITYLRPAGSTPVTRSYGLLPRSRRTIAVDLEGPELASTDVSAVITATAPIMAERAMYRNRAGQLFAAGHDSAGVTAPALEWFLAEGASGPFFDLFLLLANPGPTDASVTVDYLLLGGGVLSKTYTVTASSRRTIWVDAEELPAGSGEHPFANVAVSAAVRSTNGVPIVVERTMWWPGPETTPDFWYESHNAFGTTATAPAWLVAGGEVGGADAAETYVLIANPSSTAGSVRVTLLRDTGDPPSAPLILSVAASSRTNVSIGSRFPGVTGRFGVLVESVDTPPLPLVVEAAIYASPGGATWANGGAALATPIR